MSRSARSSSLSASDAARVEQLNALGLAALRERRFEQAEAAMSAACALAPDNPRLMLNRAALAQARGERDCALALYRQAIALAPDYALAHFNLGNLLREADERGAAVEAYRSALRFDPDAVDVLINLGSALHELGSFADAEAALRRAQALEPDDPAILTNLGNLCRAQDRLEDALACYERALALNPGCPETPLARALTLLLAGDFARGWPAYEGRWKEKAQRTAWRRFNAPEWRGEPLSGKRILVYGEQGPGDIVMFASCLPELLAHAGRVFVQCRGRIAPLFARSFAKAEVTADRVPDTGAWWPEPAVDYAVAIGSLPRYFRPTAASFQRSPTRYLVPDARAVESWRARLVDLGPGFKVGISWRGGASPLERHLRRMTLESWQPILRSPGLHFVTLQYDDCRGEIEALRSATGIAIHDFPENDPNQDLDGLCALIDALDLVVSVANTTVHLAGALGKTTLTLVPTVPSWRWQCTGDRCLWYPSVELIRQRQGEDWSPAVERAAERLAALRRSLADGRDR